VRDDAHVTAGCGLEVRYVEGEIRLRPLLERPLSSLAQVAACLYRPDRKLLSEADTKAAIRAKLKAVIHSVSSALGQVRSFDYIAADDCFRSYTVRYYRLQLNVESRNWLD
jgi:hypothetical protein